ncbi:MAG: hypothetical protein ACI97A_004030, partial [Planctomycetota bacterium]
MTKRVFILFLIFLILSPAIAMAQNKTGTPTSVQEWTAPETLADASKMLITVNAEIEKQKGDEVKEIRDVLVLQKEQLEAIISKFQATALAPEQKTKLANAIKEKTTELANEEKIEPKDYSNKKVGDIHLSEAKQKVEKLNAEIAKIRSAVEASTTKKGELLNRLEKSRGEVQKVPLAELTAAKIAVEKARAEAPKSVALLIEKQRLSALNLELESVRYEHDLELRKVGLADDEINLARLQDQILQLQLKRADTERQKISARLSAIAQKASSASSFSIDSMIANLKSLPQDQEHKRPLLELKLELAQLKVEQNSFQEEESRFSRLGDSRGLYGALNSSSSILASTIKQAKANPDEDELPSSATELRKLRDMAAERYDSARENLADIREMLPIVSKKVGDVSRSKKGITAKFASAKEALRDGGGDSSAGEWTQLGADLNSEWALYLTKVEGFSNKLKTDHTNWDRLRDSADKNMRFLSERLLWTREESSISIASLERALDDLSDGSGDLVDVVKESASRTKSHFMAEENRTRSLIALLFVFVAGFGFWYLSRKLPKTYGWLDAQATDGKNFPLVLGIILRRTDFQLMLAVIFVGAPLIAGLDSNTIQFAACVFGVPFFYRLGRVLLDVFVGPGKDEERILSLDENIAKTLHRAGRWLLNLAVFFVPIAIITELSGYAKRNPGVLEVWWLVYESLSHGILLFAVFRPAIVSNVIRGSGIVATSVKSWIFILYPLVVGGILFLYVLGSLRYLEAEQYFQTLLLKILATLFVGYIAYR